jgi:hypothetical protein
MIVRSGQDRRALRESVHKLLTEEIIEVNDAAIRMNVSAADIKKMWEKSWEIETTGRFLSELETNVSDVMTLAEFVKADFVPGTRQHLDNVCPDIVAIVDGRAVGVELTAYADNEPQDRLSAAMRRVSEIARREFAAQFPMLSGCTIFYEPNEKDILPKASQRRFTGELLALVEAEQTNRPFTQDEDRRIPDFSVRQSPNPFEGYPLLKKHVTRVSIYFRESLRRFPVSVPPGGCASTFGTSIDCVCQAVDSKNTALQRAYLAGLSETWLLIHATGSLTSSRITPFCRGEIDDVMASDAARRATSSSYQRIFLWDGLHGGHVELKTGMARECSLT